MSASTWILMCVGWAVFTVGAIVVIGWLILVIDELKIPTFAKNAVSKFLVTSAALSVFAPLLYATLAFPEQQENPIPALEFWGIATLCMFFALAASMWIGGAILGDRFYERGINLKALGRGVGPHDHSHARAAQDNELGG